MWEYDGDRIYEKDRYGVPDRPIVIDKICTLDAFGCNTKEIGRYEICENWTSKEQPEGWKSGRYIRGDKSVSVLSFPTHDEARLFLRTLAWVLNAPPQISMEQILAPTLIETAINKAEELLIAREKEAEEKREKEKFRGTVRSGDHVYILKFEPLHSNKDFIKIGHSVNVPQRIQQVKGGTDVLSSCCTKALSYEEALRFETQCHEHFADRKKPGQREYFFVPYEEACAYLRSLVTEDLIVIKE